MREPSISAVFCDDVRLEATQKMTLVGAYPGDVLVHVMPTTLPKLVAWTNIVVHEDHPIRSATVALLRDGQPIATSDELNVWDQETMKEAKPRSFVLALELQNYVVDVAHTLAIEVLIDGKRTRAREIRVLPGKPAAVAPRMK